MARLYADENLPLQVVQALRALGHAGIIVCTQDADASGQAERIHAAIADTESLQGRLIRVNRPQR